MEIDPCSDILHNFPLKFNVQFFVIKLSWNLKEIYLCR
jgi:hypothetical protein